MGVHENLKSMLDRMEYLDALDWEPTNHLRYETILYGENKGEKTLRRCWIATDPDNNNIVHEKWVDIMSVTVNDGSNGQ